MHENLIYILFLKLILNCVAEISALYLELERKKVLP